MKSGQSLPRVRSVAAVGAAYDSSRACAIVFAVITGSVTSTARSSCCIAATRLAASRDVLAMTVVGCARQN
jgi:hypothetical protein